MTEARRKARQETKRDVTVLVCEPTHCTEFEVQAVIWAGLRSLGINARGEVKCKFAGRAQVRFDIAVFQDGELAGLIECKRAEKQCDSSWEETRQGKRYSQFGVPVRLVRGMDDATKLLLDAARGALWSGDP